MEKNRNSIFQRLRLTAIFCLVAVGLIAFGIVYERYETQLIKDDKYEDISAIAKLKADSIKDWRRQRITDIKRVAVGPLVRREIARLLHDPMNTSARAALQIQLNISRKNTDYADALFLDTQGNILLSDNPNPAPVDQATMKAIEIALKDHKEVLSDFCRDPQGLIYIDAIAPILDDSSQPIAIVVLRSKAEDFLYPLIQKWPTPSKTAETLLVRRDGDSVLYLNELRHRSNTALNLRIPITNKTLPAVQTVLGKYDRLDGKDYRGVDVLAVGQPNLQTPWFIVSKVDEKEILAEVRYRAWVIFIIVVLLILISAGLISLIYRKQREVERKKAEEALRESEHRYQKLSIIDDLTQLYNSRHFYAQLEIEIERSNRYGQPLTLLMLDLDKFKDFNDTHGHIEGDYVLSRLGQVIKRCLRETDSAYRYGGEEFTIMLPMTTSNEGIVMAQRIQSELRKETFSPVLNKKNVTVSIGVTQYEPAEEMKIFVRRVDQLMYQAKKDGRDRICHDKIKHGSFIGTI
jgi:diguanylate cyclase (GGDEF)-like protein